MEEELEVFAWVGEDEHGSGNLMIKNALSSVGHLPLISTRRSNIDWAKDQMEGQVRRFGKEIRLVRLEVAEVIEVLSVESAKEVGT